VNAQAYYERYWSPEGFYPQGAISPEIQRLLSPLVSSTTRCLDVGCGDGGTCGVWLNENAGSYIGVDISSNALTDARKRGLNTVQISDAGQLPFPDNSFDLVVCTEVLEHLFEPLEAAREIRRVLRPGGFLVATVPNVAYWRRRVDLGLGRWHPMGDQLSVQQPWRDPHIRFFTSRSLSRFLATSGFESIKVGGHMGAFVRDVPVIRRLSVKSRPSRLYRRLELRYPALFGLRLYAVAQGPAEGMGAG
jgi:methionine biosynthesis protein MetW